MTEATYFALVRRLLTDIHHVGWHSTIRERLRRSFWPQCLPALVLGSTRYILQAAQADPPTANGCLPATPIKTKPRVESRRVLVTGGAGFVGSHLCTFLVERGDHVCALLQKCHRASASRRAHASDGTAPAMWICAAQVICLDNFFTGSKENVKHLLGKPNFETMRHDVVESILLEVDQIYHLACPASPIHYK